MTALPPILVQFCRMLPEPSLLLSGAGEVLRANHAATKLVGAAPPDLVGAPFDGWSPTTPTASARTWTGARGASSSCRAV